MKKPFLLFCCSFLLLPFHANSQGLRAGAAAVDVSPDVTPFQLRSGSSSYVHDPLHARAIALENGENGRVVITLLDALGVGREMCDEVKAKVAAATNWRPEDMLICATHTHTAPKGGDTSPGRIAYEKKRRDGLAEAMIRAISSMEPARVGFASEEEASEVRNRRWHYKPESPETRNPLGGLDRVRTNGGGPNMLEPAGPVDPEVCVVDVRDRQNRPMGLIANYALHYVGGIPSAQDPETGKVFGMASADYFGEFSRIMPFRIGGSNPSPAIVAMMTNGTSGDINNLPFKLARPPRAPFEQVQIVAAKTADAAWRAIKKIERYDDAPFIATRQREVEINYHIPNPEDVEKAIALLKMTPKEREAIHSRTGSVAARTVQHAEPDFEKTEKVILQAISIGDQAIVSMPFEVLVEIGLEIKEKSPFPHTFVIELANGGYGYLPTPAQHSLGGYESWLGTANFAPETSTILVKNLLEMLAELKAASPNPLK